MDIQEKEWGSFVEHLKTKGIVKIGRNSLGVITNLVREGSCSLNYNDIELIWETWQAAKAQAVPEWVSVEDRMPPVDETVLVCWDHAPDIEPDKEYTTIDENLDEYWPNCQDEPPTHWMPLPKVIEAQEPANDQ